MYNAAICINHLNESIKFLSGMASTPDIKATLDRCIFSLEALRGNRPLVNAFISQRSGILEPDVTGYSALYHAFANGHYAVAKAILTTAITKGESCYREFCRGLEEPRYLYFLFDQGADVADSQQLTPLEYANHAQNTALITQLMELRGERLRSGNLAFYHAIESNDGAYTHYLLSQSGLTTQDLSTPLSLAAASGHFPAIIAFFCPTITATVHLVCPGLNDFIKSLSSTT